MIIVKRLEYLKDRQELEVDYFGLNSKGTFTIRLIDGTLLNLNSKELEKLKVFLLKVDD